MIQGMAIFEAILPFLQTDVFNMQFSLKKRPLKINMIGGVSVPFMLYDSLFSPNNFKPRVKMRKNYHVIKEQKLEKEAVLMSRYHHIQVLSSVRCGQ